MRLTVSVMQRRILGNEQAEIGLYMVAPQLFATPRWLHMAGSAAGTRPAGGQANLDAGLMDGEEEEDGGDDETATARRVSEPSGPPAASAGPGPGAGIDAFGSAKAGANGRQVGPCVCTWPLHMSSAK